MLLPLLRHFPAAAAAGGVAAAAAVFRWCYIVAFNAFLLLFQIGSGAYGSVASFEDSASPSSPRVAVKKIGDLFRDLVDAKRILREIKILKALKHENLIHLLDIFDPLTPGVQTHHKGSMQVETFMLFI